MSPVSQRDGSAVTQGSRLHGVDQDSFDGDLHSRLWNGRLDHKPQPRQKKEALSSAINVDKTVDIYDL